MSDTGAAAKVAALATVHAGIAEYYTSKVTRFGATPPGVDWTCVPTQELRFVQLLKICPSANPLSINDLGCGYGALLAYLQRRHPDRQLDYLGIDLSAAMIRRARGLWRGLAQTRFIIGHAIPRVADFTIASGIFNVQLDQSRNDWELFIAETCRHMHEGSTLGYAVNFVRTPPAGHPIRQGLYTTEPALWANYCAEQFGAVTEIIDGYGLREFTLLVRRPASRRGS